MRVIKQVLFCLLMIKGSALQAQNMLSVQNIGTFSYSKTGDLFRVDLAELGSFDFKGSIEPLELETTLSDEQLKNFPGYDVIKALELKQLHFRIQKDSLALDGTADTKQKLKPLCEALHISAPTLRFSAQVTPRQIQLGSGLDFSQNPIRIDVAEQTGTRLSLNRIGIGADLEIGIQNQLALSVRTDLQIRPTLHDPDLKTAMTLRYDLTTMELTGTGEMNDSWTDPLSMSKHVGLKADAVTIADAAVTAGWIPGSQVPTTIGFAIDQARFMDFDYAAVIVISPPQKEVALSATRRKMRVQDVLNSLEEGFGLKFPPRLVPEKMVLDEAQILFSPTGGNVGNHRLKKGFCYLGGAQLTDSVSGNFSFFAGLEGNITLDIELQVRDMEAMLAGRISKGKETELNNSLKKALEQLQINYIWLHMEADKKLNMAGNTACELLLFGKKHHFEFDSSIRPEKIATQLLLKVGKAAVEHYAGEKNKD